MRSSQPRSVSQTRASPGLPSKKSRTSEEVERGCGEGKKKKREGVWAWRESLMKVVRERGSGEGAGGEGGDEEEDRVMRDDG